MNRSVYIVLLETDGQLTRLLLLRVRHTLRLTQEGFEEDTLDNSKDNVIADSKDKSRDRTQFCTHF